MSSRVTNSMLGFSLLALVVSGCGTATGAAVGAGVGAVGGAIYDVTKHNN